MGRRITFTLVLVILIGGGTWWFIHTKRVRMPVADGINAVPANAAIIFESREIRNTWKKISQTNIMWEELLGTDAVKALNAQAVSIDSALRLDPTVYDMLQGRPVYVSLHCVERMVTDKLSRQAIQALYITSLPDLTWQETVEDYFERVVNRGKPIYTAEVIGDAKIGVLQIREGQLLYFAISSGIVVISGSDLLLRESLHQLQEGTSIAKNSDFNKVLISSGKNVDANVYVNYQTFPSLLNGSIDPEERKEFGTLSNFAAFSGWDISLKPNEISMSGFTCPGKFLRRFSDQKPQEIELPKILPANTAAMLFYGLSDARNFALGGRYHSANSAQERADMFALVSERFSGPDPGDVLTEWMGNEIALVVTEPGPESPEGHYAVFSTGDTGKAVALLSSLNDSLKRKASHDTINYRKHCIRQLDLPGMIPKMLGNSFSSIRDNYYTTVAGYLVFANSPGELKSFIDNFESNHTLINTKNYKAFAENMSSEANIFFYSCIARSEEFYKSFLTTELAYDLHMKSDLLKKFDAAGFQFNAGNKLFYSNFYLKYNPEQKQETATLWETKLDTTVSSKPFLLVNHNTKAKEVFVQDDANKIYLISNTGKIIWTKQLDEKIMSDVIQLDVLKNDKLQMVFNTRSCIYMFDRNGNAMNGFPLKLRSPATNAISVVDYEKNRDYRIFIATENKRIVCYKANAEQVTAFAFDKTTDQVFIPLQYFSAANKDHLCAIDMKGRIYILDRHGETRVNLKEQMGQGIRGFYVEAGRDYSKSYITAADTLGNVTRISLAGKKETISLQDFETSPFVEIRDLDNDKTKEFIFLTRNELKVFAQDQSLLFKYEFPEKISQQPLFFPFPDGTCKIGVVSDLSNEVFLFNENGTLFKNFPVNGKTVFSIGDLNNDGHYHLVTGSSENSVFVYQLK